MYNNIPEIGSIIRRAREEKGMTQKELADAAGAHMRTIADIERDTRSPKHKLLYKIVHILDLSPEALF